MKNHDLTPPRDIKGDLAFPAAWTVFARPADVDGPVMPEDDAYDILTQAARQRLARAAEGEDPDLTQTVLTSLPQTMAIAGRQVPARTIGHINGQVDLRPLLGDPPYGHGIHQTPDNQTCGRIAYIFIPLESDRDQTVNLGCGADLWLEIWINGVKIYDGRRRSEPLFPPSIRDCLLEAELRAGINLLVARFVSGKGSSVAAIGGPAELRSGQFQSILADPLLVGDEQWTDPGLQLTGTSRPPVAIGSRRELFIDDFLLDGLSGGAQRRLHHPVPREIVMTLNQPWEGNCNGCFMPVVILRDGGKIMLYYMGVNYNGPGDPSDFSYRKRDMSRPDSTCLALSTDGIRFERMRLNLFDYPGADANNMIWQGPQYFTPMLDTKPGEPSARRFKAISHHPDGGLGAYVSPDGIHWSMLAKNPVITKGAFDSQNLAFWDEVRGCYMEYHRGSEKTGPRRGVRGIMTCRSDDFIHWSDPESIDYDDQMPWQMYTNCIRPYARAPHLLIGTPARLVGQRKKIVGHMDSGVSDAMLICSRDGLHFKRWQEAFIRPEIDPESWTDRNSFPAWGMLQTAPDEISLYWCEHNGFPSLRLRRGTIRTDGFVSIHAGCRIGEVLTRPLTFSGTSLTVNYATSAAGSIRFELCAPDGAPIPGLALKDSEILFGNEIEHTVNWQGETDLQKQAGQPVRLRIRLQDADLYSLRFA